MRNVEELSFLDIFNAIPDVMGLQDTSRRVLMYNEAGYRYLRKSPEEVRGRFCYELIGRSGPCDECATEKAVSSGKPTNIVKYVPENGTWLNVRAYPILNAEGNVYRVVEHLRDITESMVLQLELERLNKNLEKQVTARTSELQKTIDELTNAKDRLIESEKLSALGRMVAGFSHELSTPLGVAITSASFIKDMIQDNGHDDDSQHLEMEDLPEDFLDDLSQACRLVNANLQRAHNLISGFKHIAADQASERQRRINPVDYLEDLVLSMYHELKTRKITISVTGRKDLAVNTYPGALSQVLTNLVMNSAIHAFSEGEPGEVTIDVSSESDGAAIIHYADSGRGMDSYTLQRMYEPFFTTRIGGDGIGLGMNIVYSLVLGKLEGHIDCVSAPGQGTQFTLIIPDLTESPQPPS